MPTQVTLFIEDSENLSIYLRHVADQIDKGFTSGSDGEDTWYTLKMEKEE